MMESF